MQHIEKHTVVSKATGDELWPFADNLIRSVRECLEAVVFGAEAVMMLEENVLSCCLVFVLYIYVYIYIYIFNVQNCIHSLTFCVKQ